MKRFLIAPLALVPLLCSCSEPAWAEHFEVTCEVYGSTVITSASDLPDGAEVSVEALPELDATVNASGLYIPTASLLPLSVGQQQLRFEAVFEGHSATATCGVHRPPFEVDLAPRSAQPDAFHRAVVSFTVTKADGQSTEPTEPTEHTVTVGLDEARRYALVFKAQLLASVTHGGDARRFDDEGVFTIPVAAEVGATTRFTVGNLDGRSAQFEVSVTDLQPWTDDDLRALGGPDKAHRWASRAASRAVDLRPDGVPLRTILVDEDGGALRYTGDLRVLGDVERIARVTVTTYIVDTCYYGRKSDAEIEIQSQEAVVELFDARSGDLILSSNALRAPAPDCPDGANFVMLSASDDDPAFAANQVLTADVMPEAITWFESHSQD